MHTFMDAIIDVTHKNEWHEKKNEDKNTHMKRKKHGDEKRTLVAAATSMVKQ